MAFNKRKAFGQHFLRDTSIIDAIVREVVGSAQEFPNSTLLEIGPGRGAITRPLLEELTQKLGVEKPIALAERDRELIEYWKGESRVSSLFEGDFVQNAQAAVQKLAPLIVVSNLPYSAGTAITLELIQFPQHIHKMVLMFQAEVAQRLLAEPSTPDRGSLTLAVQNRWDVRSLVRVPPRAFEPPPKVQSEVVVLTPRLTPRILLNSIEDEQLFEDLLKQAFRQRRKMLRGNLSQGIWKSALENSGVDPTARAESLTWDQWIQIWNGRFKK